MLTRNFTFCTDHERGTEGLRADWMPNADPVGGQGCMHDMLEHFQAQSSALEGECEALGALLYLRLENGWTSSQRTVRPENWKVLANELSTCLLDAVALEIKLPSLLRTMPLASSSEKTLQATLDEAFRVAHSELDYHGDDGRSLLPEDELREAFAGWIRRGYRRAVRRFTDVDTYSVSNRLFPKVSKALDKLIESECLKEGDRVGVSLNLRELVFYVRVNGYPANELYDL